VQEFGAYDPLVPNGYFSLYNTPVSALASFGDIFSPGITSSQAARLYGISYLLEPSGTPGPKGSVFVRSLGDEDLYRVPGAAAATLVALRSDGSLPGMYASGSPVSVARPDPGTWKMVTNGDRQSVLRLRLTDVPGWRATIDGKPVNVSSFARVMLQVRVPPGRHVVELRYWPKTLSIGIVLALCSAIGLVLLLILAWLRSRRQRNSAEIASEV
jgi:Bacterial membrane protein YfhO